MTHAQANPGLPTTRLVDYEREGRTYRLPLDRLLAHAEVVRSVLGVLGGHVETIRPVSGPSPAPVGQQPSPRPPVELSVRAPDHPRLPTGPASSGHLDLLAGDLRGPVR